MNKQVEKAKRSARHFIEEYNEYKGHPRVRKYKKLARRALRRASKKDIISLVS